MMSESVVAERAGSVLERGLTRGVGATSTLEERSAARELHIQLLGRFSVSVGDRRLVDGDWYLREAMDLVKLLALAPDGRLHRQQIIGYLWPAEMDRAAGHKLDQVFSVVRRVLDVAEPYGSAPSYLTLADDSIGLASDCEVTIDVDEFDRRARQALWTHHWELYDVAIAAYAGDLLPDDVRYEWTAGPREHVTSLYRDLLEARHTATKAAIPRPTRSWTLGHSQSA